RREKKNDAGAVGDREPGQQPTGSEFLRGQFANARGRGKLRAPPIVPARALPAAGPWQRPRPRPSDRARVEPGPRPVVRVVFGCHGAKAPARSGKTTKLPIPLAGAQPAAVEKAEANQWISRPITVGLDQWPAATFAPTLAQVSRNPTVRLNTSRPAAESGSGQK